jgi:hypothetical protein
LAACLLIAIFLAFLVFSRGPALVNADHGAGVKRSPRRKL